MQVNRDSPDDPGTGLDIRGFPGSLRGRSAIRTATVTSGSPDGGRGADLAFFAGIWTHSPPSVALERMTIGRLTQALVVAVAVVPRSAAESRGTIPSAPRPRPSGR